MGILLLLFLLGIEFILLITKTVSLFIYSFFVLQGNGCFDSICCDLQTTPSYMFNIRYWNMYWTYFLAISLSIHRIRVLSHRSWRHPALQPSFRG